MAEQEELLKFAWEATVELGYVQSAEDISQCASAKGADLVDRGMSLLGLKDLSAESWPEAKAQMRPGSSTPASTPTELIKDLLGELDGIARAHDIYDYGLPLGHETREPEMIAAVNEWLKQLASVRAASTGTEWIPVSERMPEYDTDVCLWASDWNKTYIGYWRHSEEWIGRHRPEENNFPDGPPTHWQPFPAPPVASQKEHVADSRKEPK
jgi:Protein of unknown function (DUF551)